VHLAVPTDVMPLHALPPGPVPTAAPDLPDLAAIGQAARLF